MLQAIAARFSAIAGTRVSLLRDARETDPTAPGVHVRTPRNRSPEQHSVLAELAAQADWTVLIAPEFSDFLYSRARSVVMAGGRLLGPGPELIELAADKQRTAEHLAAAGVPVARGRLLARGRRSAQRRFCLSGRAQADRRRWLARSPPGRAACRAAGCRSPTEKRAPPTGEVLSRFGRQRLDALRPKRTTRANPVSPMAQQRRPLHVPGGRSRSTPALAARATRLARRAAAALPSPFGYFGIDLVLGPDDSGREDVVIEINPRLTTSYVGLRAAASSNLAAAMLDIAEGRESALSCNSQRVQFDAEGNVRRG